MANNEHKAIPPPPQFGEGMKRIKLRERLWNPLPIYKKILLIIFIPWIITLTWHRAWNDRIEFYGLVLDQYDNPVPGATVTTTIKSIDPILDFFFYFTWAEIFRWDRTIHKTTDDNGRFKITNYYGSSIIFSIYSFNKHRYEFEKFSALLYPGVTPKQRDYIEPDPKNPVIYRMRKLEETTFLITNSDWKMGTYFNTKNTNDKIVYYDVMKKYKFNYSRLLDNAEKPLTRDLRISAKWEGRHNRWAITFAPGTENGGLQISNKKLFMAPENGYKPEVIFYVYLETEQGYTRNIYLQESPDEPFFGEIRGKEPQWDDRYYFYLKSRKHDLYSRITVSLPRFRHNNGVYEVLLPGIEITANPYAGERCLDLEPNIPYEVEKDLQDDIKAVLYEYPNAKLPAPDLAARINAYNRRARRGKR